LLVLERRKGEVSHARFEQLCDYLVPGDLLVFNASRTLPALLDGLTEPENLKIEVRLASHLPDDSWLALVRNSEMHDFHGETNSVINFGLGLSARLDSPIRDFPGMWKVRFSAGGAALIDLLYRLGQPIRYRYVSRPWGLDYYQTVYARNAGSAEMPSAGRAFTWKMLMHVRKKGIETAYLTLHTGLSSYLDDELDRRHPSFEEEYLIGKQTALKIRTARSEGRRIIAVGTTVVRALESAAQEGGAVRAGHRYTRLMIIPNYALQVTDGILTGLHEPAASHLDLLSAFISPALLKKAYVGAVQLGYLWHEFGDLNLIV
jgi:S-adenosylmethionine:tRNA ribosyltransferase-isomerase